MQKQELLRVALKFSATVLYELSGFHPIDQYWDKDNFDRLYQFIPTVNSAATEFRFFVARKDDFGATIKNYNEYCRKTTYDDVSADRMFPSMKKKAKLGRGEQFKILVEHLIVTALIYYTL